MTKVSVLSNLRISGCELKDSYCISFILLFKTNFYHYIGISVIFKSQCGFSIAGAGYTYYPVREGYFMAQIISISNGSVFLVFYKG